MQVTETKTPTQNIAVQGKPSKNGNKGRRPKRKGKYIKKEKKLTPIQAVTYTQIKEYHKIHAPRLKAESIALKEKNEAHKKQISDRSRQQQLANRDTLKTWDQMIVYYSVEENCRELVDRIRFPLGIYDCPHCGHLESYHITTREWAFKCAKCRKPFRGTTGTAAQGHKVSWSIIIRILIHSIANRSKPTAKEISDRTGISVRGAHDLIVRIWGAAFNQRIFRLEENSIIAIDTVAVFGKNENRHDQYKLSREQIYELSLQILTFKQENGFSLMKVIPNLTTNTMRIHLVPSLPDMCTVYTDEHAAFAILEAYGYIHETVNHKLGEHGRGKVSNNGAESVHSSLKTAMEAHYKGYDVNLQEFADAIIFDRNTTFLQLSLEQKLMLALENYLRLENPVRVAEGKVIGMFDKYTNPPVVQPAILEQIA